VPRGRAWRWRPANVAPRAAAAGPSSGAPRAPAAPACRRRPPPRQWRAGRRPRFVPGPASSHHPPHPLPWRLPARPQLQTAVLVRQGRLQTVLHWDLRLEFVLRRLRRERHGHGCVSPLPPAPVGPTWRRGSPMRQVPCAPRARIHPAPCHRLPRTVATTPLEQFAGGCGLGRSWDAWGLWVGQGVGLGPADGGLGWPLWAMGPRLAGECSCEPLRPPPSMPGARTGARITCAGGRGSRYGAASVPLAGGWCQQAPAAHPGPHVGSLQPQPRPCSAPLRPTCSAPCPPLSPTPLPDPLPTPLPEPLSTQRRAPCPRPALALGRRGAGPREPPACLPAGPRATHQ
jgi:hypothetical protein